MKYSKLMFYLSLLIVSGCSTVRVYPVCYHDKSPPTQDEKDAHNVVLGSFLKQFSEPPEVQVTPDGRWFFAKTTSFEHSRIKKIWPRIACIGDIVSGSEVTEHSSCVDMLKYQMKKSKYDEFDIKSDGDLSDEKLGRGRVVCQRETL